MDEAEISRWNRASQLLDDVLDLRIDEQQAAVLELGALHNVQKELSRLFASIGNNSVLDSSLEDVLDQIPPAAPASNILKGTLIGNWVLGEEIGRGGMSIIYHATRTGQDFDQAAALKIMSVAFLGEHFIDSFLRERQILSDLQHPGIARLIDGGLTQEGSPYLVMQFVKGQAIDQWCKSHDAGLSKICQLMIKLCQAVAYAQHRLVVHQDIKPGNVLVDEHGQPILIDFGIARLLGSSTGEKALKAFTPDYAAPEQKSGEPITTATDVYALGILFRNLVNAEHIDNELEQILATATQTKPDHRYANARNLAEDIQAWVEKRPLRAKPSTASYRANRFIARNRLGVAAAALIVVSLVLGLATALWQAKVAEAERDLAQTQSARAMQATEFLKDLFRASDPDRSKGEQVTARDLLDQGAYQVRNMTTGNLTLKAEMLVLLGNLNREIGDLDTASSLLEEGLALSESGGGIDQRFEAKHGLAKLLMEKGEHENALIVANEAEQMLLAENRVPGSQHAALMNSILFSLDELGETDEALNRGRAALALARKKPNLSSKALFGYVYSLATASLIAEQLDDAEVLLQEATDLVGADAGDLSMQADLHSNVSGLYLRRGNLDTALWHGQQALQIASAIYPPVHLTRARLLSNLANKQSAMGRYAESEKNLRESLAIYEQLYPGEANPRVAAASNNLGHTLQQTGRYSEAKPFIAKARKMAGEAFGRDDPRYAFATNNLGVLEMRMGNLDHAEQLLNESLTVRQAKFGPDHWAVASALSTLASLRLAQSRPEEALQLSDQALALFQRIDYKNARNLVAAQTYRAQALSALGRTREAEETFSLSLEMGDDAGASRPALLAAYADFLHQQNDSRALQAIELALKAHQEVFGQEHPETQRLKALTTNP